MRFTSLLRSLVNVVTATSSRTTPILVNKSLTQESSLAYADSVLVLSLTLPSRQETCRFHLNLQTATIGQLIDEIKIEDAGVEQVHIYNENGHLLAKSCTMDSLMRSPFTIQLNQQRTFLFDPMSKLQVKDGRSRTDTNGTTIDGATIEDTVAALYHALNIMKLYHVKNLELKQEANELTEQLLPLEKIKETLATKCQAYTTRCIWCGLAIMSFQVGFLAELTWVDYSWDIVEPISYFIAFGTAIGFYAYHIMTRVDFEFLTLSDRLFLRKFYREACRISFDIPLYNRLKNRLFIVHTDLARLRAPLSLSRPVLPNPLKCKISGEELSPLDFYRQRRRMEL